MSFLSFTPLLKGGPQFRCQWVELQTSYLIYLLKHLFCDRQFTREKPQQQQQQQQQGAAAVAAAAAVKTDVLYFIGTPKHGAAASL